MRQYFAVFFAFILFSCETKNQNRKSISMGQSTGITISVDTLVLPINGNLVNVAWFRNNFYAMFETRRQNTTACFKKMIVFDKKGKFIEDVFIPEKIQNMVYCDFIVNNDSLYIKETQFEKTNLILGEYVADFALVKTRDFSNFKDELYNVYFVCHGEFGAAIRFQDKKTKISYGTDSPCPIVVNKLDSKYYATNSTVIFKVSEPQKLAKLDSDLKVNNTDKFGKNIEIVLDSSNFIANFGVMTSFVSNEKLLSLYSDNNGSYIGEVNNKQLRPVYKFPFKFSAHLNQQISAKEQVLTCRLSNNRSGILVVDGRNFNFYIIK